MPPERRRLVLLLAFLGLLIVVAVYVYWPRTTPSTAGRSAVTARARTNGPSAVTAPDVQLQALDEERPRPVDSPQRDLFRFKPKPAPAPPPIRQSPAPTAGAAPSGPPALAPIPMRFIGLVEAPQHAKKIAILSDGRGTYRGQEGDIIEGRYRILRIGVESIDMVYLDGRGRQTIRLSGS